MSKRPSEEGGPAAKKFKSNKREFSVVLGTMTFGWKSASEECGAEIAKNFISTFASNSSRVELDTAFLYSDGDSECIIGDVRPQCPGGERLEIATKAAPWKKLIRKEGGTHGSSGGAGGLTEELMRFQLETSLARLKVEKVHLFYLHAPDVATPLEDTLRVANTLYEEGKFVELGLSNYSAWETVHAWHICDKNGWIKPTVYQGMYNAITREVERELLPALKTLGIRFLAFNPLAAGLLTGKHDFSKPPTAGRFKDNSMYMARFWNKEYFAAMNLVQQACTEANISMVDASLMWLKSHSMLDASVGDGVIVGASSIAHLEANLAALDSTALLPEGVVVAFNEAWDVCRPACPKYFRP